MVKFFNCFEVRAGQEEEVRPEWLTLNEYMTAKPGYVGHRLHRSVMDNAHFRFID